MQRIKAGDVASQVGVTVIAWEYERQRKKDLDKKAKEDAFRQAVDQKYLDEKKVSYCLTYCF